MSKAEIDGKALSRSRRDLWLLRGVAFVITLLLMLTVLGSKRIEVVKRISIDYQVKKGYVLANQAPSEISVRVLGPRVFMKDFQERSTPLAVDLTKLGVGEYEVPIRDEMIDVPLGIKVLSISQSSLPVKVDILSSKRVPIRAVFGTQLPEDIKVQTVTFKPSTVEIQGAKQRLVSIDVVPTEPINISPDNFRQEIEVKLTTTDMPGISIKDSDKIVQGVIELQGELARRWFAKIPVGVKVGAGASAKSLDVTALGIHLRPGHASFLLEGAPKKIATLKDENVEAWVEVPQLKGGVYKVRLVWRLAPDIRVVKRNTDWVEVQIPPLQ